MTFSNIFVKLYNTLNTKEIHMSNDLQNLMCENYYFTCCIIISLCVFSVFIAMKLFSIILPIEVTIHNDRLDTWETTIVGKYEIKYTPKEWVEDSQLYKQIIELRNVK